jgi:hypothetical protein
LTSNATWGALGTTLPFSLCPIRQAKACGRRHRRLLLRRNSKPNPAAAFSLFWPESIAAASKAPQQPDQPVFTRPQNLYRPPISYARALIQRPNCGSVSDGPTLLPRLSFAPARLSFITMRSSLDAWQVHKIGKCTRKDPRRGVFSPVSRATGLVAASNATGHCRSVGAMDPCDLHSAVATRIRPAHIHRNARAVVAPPVAVMQAIVTVTPTILSGRRRRY